MIMADLPRIMFRMVEDADDGQLKVITGEVESRAGGAGYVALIRVLGERSALIMTDFTLAQLDTLQQLAASLAATLRKHPIEEAPGAQETAAGPVAHPPLATSFKMGDPVRVKGGDGSEMVVDGFSVSGEVLCSFWQGVRRVQAAFSASALEKSPPPQFPPISQKSQEP
jgi:uncharacterized protein YodC (DUF2158 family)